MIKQMFCDEKSEAYATILSHFTGQALRAI